MSKEWHEILNIPRDASASEIKDAFRKLAKKHHPDKKGGTDEKFNQIKEAYDNLINNEQYSPSVDLNKDSVLQFFREGFIPYSNMPKNGSDIELVVSVPLTEIANKSIHRAVEYNAETICHTCRNTGAAKDESVRNCILCKGKGFVKSKSKFKNIFDKKQCMFCEGEGTVIAKDDLCSDCDGTGKVEKKVSKKVNIPKFSEQGKKLRVKHAGHCGYKNGSKGDLKLTVNIEDGGGFSIKDNNILLVFPITYYEAVEASTIEIPTIYGDSVDFDIDAPIKPNEKFTLERLGYYNGNERGDMIVRFLIFPPEKLSSKQKDALKSMDGYLTTKKRMEILNDF